MITRRWLGRLAALLPVGAAAQQSTPVQAGAPSEARARLAGLLDGFRQTQMIHVAAELRIADHLATGPKSIGELARLTNTHADSLYRMMRLLSSYGVFAEENGQQFRLTPSAEFLRTGVPDSLHAQATIVGQEVYWKPWGALLHSVRTGETAFDHLYGENSFSWLAKNPGQSQIFNQFMDELTVREARSVVSSYDFRDARVVVDVGGGRGVLMEAILRQNTSARGILMDLPHVVEAAKKTVPADIARRVDFQPGDFFQSVPSGGDVYTLKNIIHDWEPEKMRAILANVRKAMPRGSRLLVIENIVCGPNQVCAGKTSDLTMLVRTGGRNRTEAEYRELLGASGFTVRRVVGTAPGVIETVVGAGE